MLRSVERALAYTQAVSYDAFVANQEKVDAVVRNIEVIGEAAGRVPAEIRDHYPAAPWATIRAMRNILAHGYYAVDLELVWGVVQNRLEPLSRDRRNILQREP
ncbi:MAG TPA: DUF86 domain-containing protein [Dehalococcoidia bacterium]|nr:DUF86 domain-containing protein [Dehalococcoidia bacterium]